MHFKFRFALDNKLFTLKDKILLHTAFGWVADNHIHVSAYDDREELRNQGVGKEFYSRLYELVRKAGAKYISGANNGKNIEIYRNKFGRRLFGELPNDVQLELRRNLGKLQVDYNYTVALV
jgi:GNAT superfamily N-acetyltransferase